MPSPEAGIHLAVSRTRLGQINDSERNHKLIRAMGSMIESFHASTKRLPANVLCLSELSLLPVMFAGLFHVKAKELLSPEDDDDLQTPPVTIYVCEGNVQMLKVLRNYFQSCPLAANVQMMEIDSSIAELTRDHFKSEVPKNAHIAHFSPSRATLFSIAEFPLPSLHQ